VLQIKRQLTKPKPKNPDYAPLAPLGARLESLKLSHDPLHRNYKQALNAFAARIDAASLESDLLQALTFQGLDNKMPTNEKFITLGLSFFNIFPLRRFSSSPLSSLAGDSEISLAFLAFLDSFKVRGWWMPSSRNSRG